MDNTENQNIEQQPTTQPADNGNQGGGKMFTQEEVNQIIKERLDRERAKAKPPEPTEEEKRAQELTARENKLSCREYLVNSGHPAELLDILDTSDPKDFQRKAESLMKLFRTMPPYRGSLRKVHDKMPSTSSIGPGSGFEKGKHTPKPFMPSVTEY